MCKQNNKDDQIPVIQVSFKKFNRNRTKFQMTLMKQLNFVQVKK